jgi:hypothetical protein
MRIVITRKDAGSSERVTVLDWQFDEARAEPHVAPVDSAHVADAWARHAASANGFGAAEASASHYQDKTAPTAFAAEWPRAATA